MRSVSAHIYWLLGVVALIVFGDEWLKYQSLQRLPDEGSLVDPGVVEFAIHRNWGIAFNIPFQMGLVILFSVVIGLFLLHIAFQNRERHPDITFATIMIVFGAMGNLFDRIVYSFTVDYIILFGRSAINISDIVIVSGVILLLLSSRRTKTHKLIHPDEPVD